MRHDNSGFLRENNMPKPLLRLHSLLTKFPPEGVEHRNFRRKNDTFRVIATQCDILSKIEVQTGQSRMIPGILVKTASQYDLGLLR